MSNASTQPVWTPKPIRELVPSDFGGIIARKGFAYQDHVAAQFCLDMMLGHGAVEVWCETYDDIVLVYQESSGELIEFAQVKNEELNQLWSVAKLCQRKDGEAGSSLLEKNLARDCCTEPVRFRICTSLPANKELQLLGLPLTHAERSPSATGMLSLCASLSSKIGSFRSPNGNGVDFWTSRSTWTSGTSESIIDGNKIRLHKLLEENQVPAYVDTLDLLYETLLWRVKKAAEADWRLERETKCLCRAALLEWLLDRSRPLPNLKHDERLAEKLQRAGLDSIGIEAAKSLRRIYMAEIRQPRYLDTTSSNLLSDEIPAVLNRLRSELDSGQRQENGIEFHQECLREISKLPGKHGEQVNSDVPEGFLAGCMYEVTARCRHRFIKPSV